MDDDRLTGDAEQIRQTRDKADEILRDIETYAAGGVSQQPQEATRDDQSHGGRNAEESKTNTDVYTNTNINARTTAIDRHHRDGARKSTTGIGIVVVLIPLAALSLFALSQIPEQVASQSDETGPSTSSSREALDEGSPLGGEELDHSAKGKSQDLDIQGRPPQCGEWGCRDVYKFGRIPDDTYPHSCAFSRTDPRGMTIVSRSPSEIEYWACRDKGGDQSDGYSVSWADGKETRYTFGSGGRGTIVGTDGEGYPMRWKNSIHRGTPIIVINHEDGAESWIPGRVDS